jgi:hypothetical protein
MSFLRDLDHSIQSLRHSFRRTRAYDRAERSRNQILYEDVFLVSFPKSGNTWTRFLITGVQLWLETQGRAEPNFYNIHSFVPDIHIQRISGWRPAGILPRIIKSHREFTTNYRRVIYVVRDVRDVVISRFHFANQRKTVYPEFDPFLRDRRFGAEAWVRHVNSWLTSATHDQGRLMIVRYEDLLLDPVLQMTRMATFMNVTLPEEAVEWAAKMAGRERLQSLENTYGRPRPAPVLFVRKGTKGQWKEELSEDQLAYLQRVAGDAMSTAGYTFDH